jgi:exoribonuclease-2
MFILFEESGGFKAGTILADNDAALQVETSHGKRVKIKSNHVLLRFREPSPAELLDQAEALAESLEADFLWEVCGDDEFDFIALAEEYHGRTPNALEATALLLRLHASPIYFHRKGRGRFRKAPPDILKAALAGQEKKRQQAEIMEQIRAELVAGRLPEAIAGMVPQLLYRPDRNRLETKAFEAACVDAGLSGANLMLRCGALSSSYDFHYQRFLFEYFPNGTGFGQYQPPAGFASWPLADVRAFSIDDLTTTEIDDAFSITPLPAGGWRIGIHIAAPALGFQRGSDLDQIARTRLSTVYMPGNKITMLPDDVVDVFTLKEGHDCPAVSLYLEVTPALAVTSHYSRVERVPIVANLRLHELEPVFNEQTLENGLPDFPWRDEIKLLWDLATVLEAGRGKASTTPNQTDYSFYVDWQIETADGPGHVSIGQRQRGAPLDKLVSELMIFANSTWGKLLDEAEVPGLYRAQSGGKVRMTTHAEPHDGLGVDCYAWSSSPLRRYVDLVNQWQIISVLQDNEAPFQPRSTDLMAALRDFELTYASYAEFQRRMERYWCLRWLRQHGCTQVEARVLRDNVVRLENMPLVIKVHALPPQLPGSLISVRIDDIDLMDVDVSARYLATLAEPAPEEAAQLALQNQ